MQAQAVQQQGAAQLFGGSNNDELSTESGQAGEKLEQMAADASASQQQQFDEDRFNLRRSAVSESFNWLRRR